MCIHNQIKITLVLDILAVFQCVQKYIQSSNSLCVPLRFPMYSSQVSHVHIFLSGFPAFSGFPCTCIPLRFPMRSPCFPCTYIPLRFPSVLRFPMYRYSSQVSHVFPSGSPCVPLRFPMCSPQVPHAAQADAHHPATLGR